jgi:type IV secretion system protein VirD4
MSATKILWGQIATVFLIVLMTTWAATQWTAYRLGFQPQLGLPWFELGGWPIYYPPAFFWWWYFYDAYAPPIFIEGGLYRGVRRLHLHRRRDRHVGLAGARGEERRDIRFRPMGGRPRSERRRPARARMASCSGSSSATICATTVPSMCCASRRPIRQGRRPGRAVAADLAGLGDRPRHQGGELDADRRLRRVHGRALLFDPTNAKLGRLQSAARGPPRRMGGPRRPEHRRHPGRSEGSLEKRNHWEKTSHALLVGAILHVLYAEADKTLAGVAPSSPIRKRPIDSTLAAMMKTAHLGEAGPHPVIASAARELLNKSDNERSGVLSTAMSFLGLYRDPVVAEVTRRCDWRIADLIGASGRHDALPRRAALGHQPDQAAHPPDAQPDRPRLTEDLKAGQRRHRC